MTLQVKQQTAVRDRCTVGFNGVKVLVGSMNSGETPYLHTCLTSETINALKKNVCIIIITSRPSLCWQDVPLAFNHGEGQANVPACSFHFLLQCL